MFSIFGSSDKKPSLPPNTHGNLPEYVSPEEQGYSLRVKSIENPTLLTPTQLKEQIGESKMGSDPFSYVFGPLLSIIGTAPTMPLMLHSPSVHIPIGSCIIPRSCLV
jgi:hypothetical protein